ncbi:MAG: leucine-rich repeat domain-containing protein [Bacteroidales bacterium]|nr:leucine-rich repeat domain-containing protein [Bacteroidales bacterium]MDD4822588.1 leucine-rich repeat domain-containing protein [Bacteroidales bacterium]
MKKLIVLLFFCCVCTAQATEFWVNNLKYTVNADSCTVFVTKGISFEPYWVFGSSFAHYRLKEDSTHQPLSGVITLPESVSYQGKSYPLTVIGSYAFKDCKEVTSIRIPESVETIEEEAFIGCSSLQSLSIPSKVSTLLAGTFEGCTSLTSISIPSTITKIGPNAFAGCSSLVRFDVAADNPNYSEVEGVLYTKDKKSMFLYPNAKSANVIIPSGITAIGTEAFRLCDNLVSLKLPEGMRLIGDKAFEGCTHLTSLSVPESVQYYGRDAFSGCTSLTSITIPAGIATLYPSTFAGCTALSRFFVSEEHPYLSEIDGVLFTKERKTLVICPNAKSKSYAIPDSVTNIEQYAFSECSKLTSITLPDSLLEMGEYAFSNCSALTSMTIPKGVTMLAEGLFSGCSKLTSVSIPKSVTEIGENTFSNCSALTSITIPEGVISIGRGAFEGCSKLTSITIPNSLTDIEEGTFSKCTALTRFVVAKNHPDLSVVGGVLFSKDKTKLLSYPIGSKRKSYAIPSGVTDVAYAAFSGCSHLTSLTISSPEYSQFRAAFNGTQSLKELHVKLEKVYKISLEYFSVIDIDRSHCVLYVPKGSKPAYQKDFFWKEFKQIVEE